MSGTLLTQEKKITDTMASLLLSDRAPPDWGLYSELATMVDRRVISAENVQGDSPGVSPPPTGTLPSLQGNHWRSKCPCLQMDGEVPPHMD
jgi:hypothetical protein